VITLPDHQYFARTRRFSKLVIGCHVASYESSPNRRTLRSALRLAAKAAQQRLADSDQIDLFDWPWPFRIQVKWPNWTGHDGGQQC
jgi:hypothetical protein